MPNPIIQNYLNDSSVALEKRKGLLEALNNKTADIDVAAQKIVDKYGLKYIPASELKAKMPNPFSTPTALGGSVGTGIGKGAISTVMGASELMARGAGGLLGAAGLPGPKEQDFEKMEQMRKDITTPEGIGETIGFGAEQIWEYIAPVGMVTKGVKAIKGMTGVQKLGKAGQTAVGIGATSALEAGTAGGVAAAQAGKLDEGVLTVAAISAAIPFAGAALKPLIAPFKKYLGKTLPRQQIAKLIRPHKNAYLFGKDPAKAIVDEKIVARNFDDLVSKIKLRKDEIGTQIVSNVDDAIKIGAKKTSVKKIIQGNADDFAKSVTDDAMWKAYSDRIQQLTGKFKADLKTGQLVKTGSKQIDNLNAKEVWELQQKLGKLTQWTGAAYEKPINQQLHKLYRQLGVQLDNLAPGTKELQTRWANMLGAEKSAVSRLAVEVRNNNLMRYGIGGMLGGTTAPIKTGNEWLDRAVNVVGGALVARMGQSPAFKTKLAKFLTSEGFSNSQIAEIVKAGTKYTASQF